MGKPSGKQLGDLGVDGKVILKYSLRTEGLMLWTEFIGSELGQEGVWGAFVNTVMSLRVP